MLNFNGELLVGKNLQLSCQNRGFKYGDALFETIKSTKSKLIFWEDHYFRLMSSMRILRMKIPMAFTLEYLEHEILKTISTHHEVPFYRIRLSVFRKDGGFYTPISNEVDFLIEVSELNYQTKSTYSVDVYKDFYNYSGLLSTIKTTNRMLNTLASIYAKENGLDNCVLINENKGVVEVANGNIFILTGNIVKTPAITEGCIRGIIRKKVIEIIKKNPEYMIEETNISHFEIQKADEVFITNAIIGIQPVTDYKKKTFGTSFSEKIEKSLQVLEITTA
ncbi:MAG: aminotransferase class IV [Flavobacteriia bacterium]|nr:aminotransferase class IV [Flavobacteriia bacterium]OIP45871.1 MAG: aminotransferase class IV [Flavobacteriaceae bacterium CG2_30_31_66]PIV96991.1 MAG: aminotransferase class IV [Flavobacteriaceae bacterium CG17_big_fil_post_rev_8_21_14_2_50_31_13]PIX14616.1 MAG: aminotransferase class IV [Flavobacteriaceae bacterium CG_4_8_14_3_um_filter_31_8]PIY15168.1 MAG: aminotransferase class IV [Flavobacteriaceae bacterium CG_4_10_14_3_um_filter_31_253]PIZ09494.1 MAG: aminotransferase class IV [Flavo